MLVLTRKTDEAIVIDGRIKITVLRLRGNRIRLGIEAPSEMSVRRGELAPRGTALEASLAEPSALSAAVLREIGGALEEIDGELEELDEELESASRGVPRSPVSPQ